MIYRNVYSNSIYGNGSAIQIGALISPNKKSIRTDARRHTVSVSWTVLKMTPPPAAPD